LWQLKSIFVIQALRLEQIRAVEFEESIQDMHVFEQTHK